MTVLLMLREPLSLGWDGPSSWMMLDAWESAGNRGEGLDGVHKTFGSLLAQKQLEMLGWWKVRFHMHRSCWFCCFLGRRG